MNKEEYAEYEANFADFIEKNNAVFLAEVASSECPVCCEQLNPDPSFGKAPCEICGTHLHGNRFHFVFTDTSNNEQYCVEICQDCQHYNEYGQLDDLTMLKVEES